VVHYHKAGRSAEVLRTAGGVDVEVGTDGHCLIVWQSHIYKDAWSLRQAKGLPSLIHHDAALEVRFVSGSAGSMSILTIRRFAFKWTASAVRNIGWSSEAAGQKLL
jgi:hypothetical protein